MTTKTLEQEAREAQRASGFLAQPGDLSGCQHERSCAAFRVDEVTGYFDGAPCDCGAQSRWADLAAKRMRAYEQEIAELLARVAELEGYLSKAQVALVYFTRVRGDRILDRDCNWLILDSDMKEAIINAHNKEHND